MSCSSVESALYVYVARVRRNACASLVFRGSTDNKDRYCLNRSFGILPVMRLSLVVLNTDLEVKVVSVTTGRRLWLRTRVDTTQPVQSSSALWGCEWV